MAMCFTLIPTDYHHLKQKSLTFSTIILCRGDTIVNVFKVYRVKFVDLTVSSHWMLLLEDTIYRNIFHKHSFQQTIIETIEMYPCGLINNTEICTIKPFQ